MNRHSRRRHAGKEHGTRIGHLGQFRRGATVAYRSQIQRAEIFPAQARHGRALHGRFKLLQQGAVGRELADPAAFVQGHPIIAQYVDRRAVRASGIGGRTGSARLPARWLRREGKVRALGAEGVRSKVIGPGQNMVARRVGPVQRAVVRAPGQAIGGQRLAGLLLHRRRGERPLWPGIHAIQRGGIGGLGLVHGAHPKAPQRVTLAIVGAHRGWVVGQRGNPGQRATPCGCAENTVAQRNHQSSACRRGNAPRL